MRLGMRRPGWGRRVRCCAVAPVIAVTQAACGSMTATGTGTGTSAGTRAGTGTSAGTRAAAVPGCPASSLRVPLDLRAAGAAAGSSFLPLDFTNISRSTCHLAGYPQAAFATAASGQQVGTAAALDRSALARPVAPAPGASAHAWLQVTDALSFPARQCHPVMANGLRVTLPGQGADSYIMHALPACAAAMHGRQILTVQPIQPGLARPGTAQ
jgi:hypothetical protein